MDGKGKLNSALLNDYYYQEACDRFYNNFERLLANPDYPSNKSTNIPKFGIIVMDEPSSTLSKIALKRIKDISSKGTKYRPSDLVFWGITFTNSDKNFGVETAGYISFALRRAICDDELSLINLFKGKIYRTNDGYIDNYGFCFFDCKRSRQRYGRVGRCKMLEESTGEKFRNLTYNECIHL
jgi:hypothetical protein